MAPSLHTPHDCGSTCLDHPFTQPPALSTQDGSALARVSVVTGDISAAVDHAPDGRDAEVVVANREVSRERRRCALDVETIVSCAFGDIAS